MTQTHEEELRDMLRESMRGAIQEAGLSTSYSDGTERGAPAASSKYPPTPITTQPPSGQTKTPVNPGLNGTSAVGEMRGAAQSAGRGPFSTGGPAPLTDDGFGNVYGAPPASLPSTGGSEHISDNGGSYRTPGPSEHVTDGHSGPTQHPISTDGPMLRGYKALTEAGGAVALHAHQHGHLHDGGQQHGHDHVHHHHHTHGGSHLTHAGAMTGQGDGDAVDAAAHQHDHKHMHDGGHVHSHPHVHSHLHVHGDDAQLRASDVTLSTPGEKLLETVGYTYAGMLCATCSHTKGHHQIAGMNGACLHCGPKGSMHKFNETVDMTPHLMTIPLHAANPPDSGDVNILTQDGVSPARTVAMQEATYLISEPEAHRRMFTEQEQALIRLDRLVEALLPWRGSSSTDEGPSVKGSQMDAARDRAETYNAHSVAAHRQSLAAYMSGNHAEHHAAAAHHGLAADAASAARGDYPDNHPAHKDYHIAAGYHKQQLTAHQHAGDLAHKSGLPGRYDTGATFPSY